MKKQIATSFQLVDITGVALYNIAILTVYRLRKKIEMTITEIKYTMK